MNFLYTLFLFFFVHVSLGQNIQVEVIGKAIFENETACASVLRPGLNLKVNGLMLNESIALQNPIVLSQLDQNSLVLCGPDMKTINDAFSGQSNVSDYITTYVVRGCECSLKGERIQIICDKSLYSSICKNLPKEVNVPETSSTESPSASILISEPLIEDAVGAPAVITPAEAETIPFDDEIITSVSVKKTKGESFIKQFRCTEFGSLQVRGSDFDIKTYLAQVTSLTVFVSNDNVLRVTNKGDGVVDVESSGLEWDFTLKYECGIKTDEYLYDVDDCPSVALGIICDAQVLFQTTDVCVCGKGKSSIVTCGLSQELSLGPCTPNVSELGVTEQWITDNPSTASIIMYTTAGGSIAGVGLGADDARRVFGGSRMNNAMGVLG